MNAAMEIQAATLAAKAGFGKARMMKIAEEVAGRSLKHLGELNEEEGERVMLMYAVLATPVGELETLREVRDRVEKVVPKEVRKRMQVEYQSANTKDEREGKGVESVREARTRERTRTA